jgi:hypothetical protein
MLDCAGKERLLKGKDYHNTSSQQTQTIESLHKMRNSKGLFQYHPQIQNNKPKL